MYGVSDLIITIWLVFGKRGREREKGREGERKGGRGRKEGRERERSKLVCHELFLYVSNGLKHSPSLSTAHTQDLTELVAMCSSQQWSERRDGIAQLHILLESSRPFS